MAVSEDNRLQYLPGSKSLEFRKVPETNQIVFAMNILTWTKEDTLIGSA